MKKIFYFADKFIKASNWKDLALLKFCLFSLGIIIGLIIPKRQKKSFAVAASCIFTATYIPLMIKFFQVTKKK